jgi:hypothetical protein
MMRVAGTWHNTFKGSFYIGWDIGTLNLSRPSRPKLPDDGRNAEKTREVMAG